MKKEDVLIGLRIGMHIYFGMAMSLSLFLWPSVSYRHTHISSISWLCLLTHKKILAELDANVKKINQYIAWIQDSVWVCVCVNGNVYCPPKWKFEWKSDLDFISISFCLFRAHTHAHHYLILASSARVSYRTPVPLFFQFLYFAGHNFLDHYSWNLN